MVKLYPVIMSGGAGTRLWPLSRQAKPKQYIELVGKRTFFEQTLIRCMAAPDGIDRIEIAAPSVIGAQGHHKHIAAGFEAEGVHPLAIILEPMPRNTAVVASVAARHVLDMDEDGIILMLPADHHIADVSGFWEAVEAGVVSAQAGKIVTLGIAPTAPETGYGYIRRGAQLDEKCYEVERFTEKPDAKTASAYLEDGRYFWNAGIFLFSAKAMLEEMDKYAGEIRRAGDAAYLGSEDVNGAILLSAGALEDCPAISIDYAIMEKTKRAAVVGPVCVGWDDAGSWAAIDRLSAAKGTEAVSRENSFELDGQGNYILSRGRMIAAIGVDNLVIVETDDAVLIVPKDRTQDVSTLVKQLKARGYTDLC